jgi:mRNA-degrading endonuclease toxin of MazEF toxin-antitoxin module
MPDRGEVWLANLGPGLGTERGKRRPVLIAQSQASWMPGTLRRWWFP